MQEKGKVVDLEPEEDVEEIHMEEEDSDMGVEEIDVEGSNPISKFPQYIPLHRCKTKVLKYIDESKVNIPLLPNKIILKDCT